MDYEIYRGDDFCLNNLCQREIEKRRRERQSVLKEERDRDLKDGE